MVISPKRNLDTLTIIKELKIITTNAHQFINIRLGKCRSLVIPTSVKI